jgi:hypothetical protein
LNFCDCGWLTETDPLMLIFNQPPEIDRPRMFCAGRPR